MQKAQLLHSFREPRTPERNRQSEREQERLQQLQMTSPSVRRQREYNRQPLMPQPNFGVPPIAGPSTGARVNWEESLHQGF